MAAHELKTPVTTLRLTTQALVRELDRTGSLDLNRARRLLERSDDRAANLSRLVDELLDVSRLETGRLTLDRQRTDVAELVTKIAAAVQLATNRHTLTVRALSQALALVDPLRLEQVLTNLLDNAIKYSPEGGPIDVEVALPHPAMIQVAVRDRGVGIPPERRPQIFDRFHQAQALDPRAGLGLGLYISRQIVELHGGRLDVEFPADGGSRFVISLPTDLAASIKAGR